MSMPDREKAYSGKKFTYAAPHDPRMKRWVIAAAENLTGRRHLQRIYEELHEEQSDPINIWGRALAKLNISMDYNAEALEKVPKTGPVIFVANHPFGIVDGAILCHLTTRVRKDYFLLINEVVSHEPLLKDYLLPVDFRENREAVRTNIATKQEASERLRKGQALAIFPSGGVATAKKIRGEPSEFPWRRFISSRIHEHQCTVVPIFFHGRNSSLFHLVSKFSMNLRLGLLLHETMNKRGKTVRITIGDPIQYEEMAPYRKRQELVEYLQERTLALGKRDS